MLRFATCGSVDDGKSTLIGRLLYESQALFEDQLTQVAADSKRFGTQGDELDLALLVDGLAAEREQGITIDVAYRFFSTPRRKFIVADSPGHEQYTRNMVTGASTADLAIILIDARHGVVTQTRRHSYLVSLIGIDQVVVAVNKMDLVGFSRDAFEAIEATYRDVADRIGIEDITTIPLSALHGDNVVDVSPRMPWYEGPALLDHLERAPVHDASAQRPFRFPVQWVNRPSPEFRGYSGLIAGGEVRPRDAVRVLPSQRTARIERIVTHDGDLAVAAAGESVTLVLDEEIDVSRGDLLVAADAPAVVAEQLRATVVWMSEEPMVPSRQYLLKVGASTVPASMSPPRHRIDVNTLERVPATRLELNEIGSCEVHLDRPVAFDPYVDNRETGGFILIDRFTYDTVAAGVIEQVPRPSENLQWQSLSVSKQDRSATKGQRPCVVWFTGLSGAGKSTLANLVEVRLVQRGMHTALLDGDNVRHGLSRDLGFSIEERAENIRRVAEVARLMVDAGLIVLVAFISPFRAERDMARSMLEPGEFVEVHVDTTLEIAEARDRKGLYRRARSGEIPDFTGIGSPYEAPEDPEVRIDTSAMTADEAAERIVASILERAA